MTLQLTQHDSFFAPTRKQPHKSQLNVWLPAIKTGSGTDFFTQRLAEGLLKKGIKATITWFPHVYELTPQLLRHVDPPLGTNIIHTNSWHGTGFFRRDIPMVVTVHHVVFDPEYCRTKTWARALYHQKVIRPHERMAFERANAITAVSQYSAKCAEKFNDAPLVHCIYNWVDTEFFRPAKLNILSNRFRLLFVGNPIHHKGADLLVPIMRDLGNEYELYYTTTPKTPSLPAQSSNMYPLGRLDQAQILRAYQECDALLFPTRGESGSYAVIEAMACGKPVITSRNSSLSEYVADGITGHLCSTGNTSEFIQAIRRLKEDKSICDAMGRAGRERILAHFSANRSIESYIKLYQSISR